MSRVHKLLVSAATLGVVGCLGCPNTTLYVPDAGEFRGITIPLPPPSFTDASTVTIDVEGNIGQEPEPGTVVGLWESEQEGGYLVAPADDGDFLFESIEVVPDQSCLEIYYQFPDDGHIVQSTSARYKVIVVQDDPECGMDELCSEPDDNGHCLCLELRFNNC